MKIFNRKTGRLAEDFAVKILEKKGYKIIKRNFGNRFGEIDIIAQDDKTLVFVEVKAKTGKEFGFPEEMITAGKLARVRHMAMLYLKGCEVSCRIDVIAVVLSGDNNLLRLTHYQNVTFR